MGKSTSIRNSQIEILRILAMLMIVAHHYAFYGVYQNYMETSPEIAWGGDEISK